MDINDIFTKGLNIDDALDLLWPVSVYVLGMGAYAIFVFKFYRFVATRDIFDLDLNRYEGVSHRLVRSSLQVILYVFKYLIVFPVLHSLVAVSPLYWPVLPKGNFLGDAVDGSATVSAIRVTPITRKLSGPCQILPFAVLGIFLIDASFFSVSESLDTLKEARSYSERILYYLAFLIGLEFVLRLLMGLGKLTIGLKNRLRKHSSSPATTNSATADDS